MVQEANRRRDNLTRLVQTLVAEGQRIGHAFGQRNGVHSTDVEALTRILVAGDAGHPLTAGELASDLGLSTGAVTSLIDRLERAGHVRRERDTADRRRVILHYGDAGLELAARFFSPLGELHGAATQDFSDEELAVVERYLQATVEVFQRYSDALSHQP